MRPMRDLRITLPRLDSDYSVSNRAVVDVKKNDSRNTMNLVQSIMKINSATCISNLKFIHVHALIKN